MSPMKELTQCQQRYFVKPNIFLPPQPYISHMTKKWYAVGVYVAYSGRLGFQIFLLSLWQHLRCLVVAVIGNHIFVLPPLIHLPPVQFHLFPWPVAHAFRVFDTNQSRAVSHMVHQLFFPSFTRILDTLTF